MSKRWDVFCRIVDNFGDIGVCWRLSRQLAHEHGLQVRLFIDDLQIASRIIPGLDSSQASQTVHSIEVHAWHTTEALNNMQIAEVVLETFSCGLPEGYLQKMPTTKPVWINLEYLSAESWVDDFHARPSQHPTLPLTKYYFFPGFTAATGGLVRERELMATRDAFLASKIQQQKFWAALGLKELMPGAVNISLFCYPQANIHALFLDLAQSESTVNIFIPSREKTQPLDAARSGFVPDASGKVWRKGKLSIYLIPFLSQTDYDSLLWACDLNFVRGEDSWIRAIWAGKPFIWQPYIQDDEVHLQKLKAFLEVYCEGAPSDLKTALISAHLSWSQAAMSTPQHWQNLIKQLPILQSYASRQAKLLAEQADLAAKLVFFSENLIQNKV